MNQILVVDDEEDILLLIKDILELCGYSVVGVSTVSDARSAIDSQNFSCMVLDIWLQNPEDGIGLLRYAKDRDEDLQVIMISGHGNVRLAVEALRIGAFDYVEKPFSRVKISTVVRNAVNSYKLKAQLRQASQASRLATKLVGSSRQISSVRNEALDAAKSTVRVLIEGPTGSGKELTARFIHLNSAQRNDEFIVVTPLHPLTFSNLETGLISTFKGTVFLDEITEFSLPFQKRLTDFLSKIPHHGKVQDDVRFIASTRYEMERSVERKEITKCLFERLSIMRLEIPPLEERLSDMAELCNSFAQDFAESNSSEIVHFTTEAITFLQTLKWPGNVRQLKNLVEWALISNPNSSTIDRPDLLPQNLPKSYKNFPQEVLELPLKDARAEFEKEYLSFQLRRCGGSIVKAAEIIDMDRSALHRKLKLLDLVD